MGDESINGRLLLAVVVVGAIFLIVLLTDVNDNLNHYVPLLFDGLSAGVGGLYFVSLIIYVKDEELVPGKEQETPLGILFGRGLGPIGNLLGEGIQVFTTLMVGKWIILGLGLLNWDLDIPEGKRWLLTGVGIALIVSSLLSALQRLLELVYDV